MYVSITSHYVHQILKFEIQLETLELKKGGLEDKLKRFKEVQIKLEENKKIDEINENEILFKSISSKKFI